MGMRDSVGSVRHPCVKLLLFKGNVVALNYTYCILKQPRRMVFILFLKLKCLL